MSGRRYARSEIAFAWEDPPVIVRRGRATLADRIADPLAKLRHHPGKWAQVLIYRTAGSAYSACTNLAHALGGDYEWTSRTLDDGTGAVYGRYVGGDL